MQCHRYLPYFRAIKDMCLSENKHASPIKHMRLKMSKEAFSLRYEQETNVHKVAEKLNISCGNIDNSIELQWIPAYQAHALIKEHEGHLKKPKTATFHF